MNSFNLHYLLPKLSFRGVYNYGIFWFKEKDSKLNFKKFCIEIVRKLEDEVFMPHKKFKGPWTGSYVILAYLKLLS